MSLTSFNDIPDWIQRNILGSLDFPVKLKARSVCRRWNSVINKLLSTSTILNIHLDSSIESRRFRHGKWTESLLIPYQEIRIIPKPKSAFLRGKSKTKYVSSLKHLTSVKKLTLYENGTFLHFVHRYIPLLNRLKYINIRELNCDRKACKDSKYTYLGHVYSCAVRHLKTWYKCQENLGQVETFRVKVFDRLAALCYIQAFTFRTCNLINVELDFSKFHGIPLQRFFLNELNGAVCDLLEHCFLTLRQLRLKWAVRVDTDIDYARSDEDIEPFFEFLLSLRNPIWNKLRLDILYLSFPTINLALNLSELYFYPFLEKLAPRAVRINLARVLPNAGIDTFMRQMPQNTYHKFEFNFYFTEADLLPQPVPLIRSIEVLCRNRNIDQFLIATLSRLRLAGSKHYQSLKFITGNVNEAYVKPNIYIFTQYFPNLKHVEFLDSSGFEKPHGLFTTEDFNLIVGKLPRLCSLRLANAALEDAQLTNISVEDMLRMKSKGVFYLPNYSGAPVSKAKELRYLDLRDLPPTLSDFAVYFAFQHIKRLEKISFHGKHSITDWGKGILERKKGKNPTFAAIFRSAEDDQVIFGNYSNPCGDFP